MATVLIPIEKMNSTYLPPICVVTGATEGVVWKDVHFRWKPWPWVRARWLPDSEEAYGQLPFTESSWKVWRRAQDVAGLWGLLIALGALGAVFALGAAGRESVQAASALGEELAMGGVFLYVVTMVGLVYLDMRGPSPAQISYGLIKLQIPNKDAARAFSEQLAAD